MLSKFKINEQDFDKYSNEILKQSEKLYYDFLTFSRKVFSLSDVLFPNYFMEEVGESDFEERRLKRLSELLTDIKTLSERIKKDIQKLNFTLLNSERLSEKETILTNQNFKELLTEYEVVFSRLKSYINNYNFDANSELKIKEIFNRLIEAMGELDEAIYKYNSTNNYKLIQPFDESKLASELQNYGFKFVQENEIGSLVIYR